MKTLLESCPPNRSVMVFLHVLTVQPVAQILSLLENISCSEDESE